MKKIPIIILALLVLFSMPGCFVRTITMVDKQFDTLDGLKAAAGDQLLYPAGLPPEGFEPTHIEISGYDDKTSWNYRIFMRDDEYMYSADDKDWVRRFAPANVPDEGSPAISTIYIYAFVPREYHPQGGRSMQWPNMWEEVAALDRYLYISGQDANAWEIGGIDVSYEIEFAAVPEKEDDEGKPVPAYAGVSAYAGFMHGGLLYIADARLFGHFDESEERLCDMGESLVKGMVTELIYGEG